MNPLNPAIAVLVAAYKARHAGAPHQSDGDIRRYVLNSISNPHQAKSLGIMLDDSPGLIQLKPSELIELMQNAIKAEQLLTRLSSQLNNSENEYDYLSGLIKGASDVLNNKNSKKEKKDRYGDALYQLRLTGEENGEGRSNPLHPEAAELYHALRAGEHYHINGKLEKYNALSHDDAVAFIEEKFSIQWESLERAWRRIEKKTGKEISPSKQAKAAKVYPIK